jgi:hypothetical protein
VTGWLADTFRILWSASFWNARKTVHRLRGGRDRAPCQVASDSGRAHETACEPALHYASPGRHRAACPLLVRRQDGSWICSAHSEDVRPFWARGLLLLAGSGVLAYALGVLVVFGGLRGLGYDLAFRQVAWPPAWREFRAVQSRFHLERAREARAQGRPEAALLALSSAYELNPRNYPAGILLAQLWQGAQAARSDALFSRLYEEHPEHREQTAQTWYRALLARGDFATILLVAGDRLLATESAAPQTAPASAAWTHAFLFAARRINDDDVFDRLLESPRFPAALRPLFTLERALPTLPAEERIRTLATAAEAASDSFTRLHLLRHLLAADRPDLALPFLLRADPLLGDRERVLLLLDALARSRRTTERANLFQQLLARPTHPALVELLCTHLIAHPDPESLAALAKRLAAEPLPADEAGLAARLAWFATCGVHADAPLLQAAAEDLVSNGRRERRPLDLAAEAFLRARGGFRLEIILPLLQPLPLETTYALYERTSPPRPFPR